MKKIFLIAAVLSISILHEDKVFATEKEYSLKEDIVYASSLMEELLTEEYELKLDEIKTMLQDSEYDYALSMESLYQKGSPFVNVDYQSLIAAYLTVSRDGFNITEMEFLEVECEENFITEYKPYKTYDYVLREDGNYDKGNVRYITTEEVAGVYEKNEDGTYTLIGEEIMSPEKVKTMYLDISIYLPDKDFLLEKYATNDDAKAEYDKRIIKLESAGLSKDGLAQSFFIKYADNALITEDAAEAVRKAIENVGGNRQSILKTACSLIGKIPYEWGGKPSFSGYDSRWWTITEAGKQKGLDCSGYVQWVYMTSGYDSKTYQNLLSTHSIAQNLTQIPKEELMPGDIGLFHDGSEGVNHAGIYIGDGYYIHCSSQANTVTVTKAPFTLFYRVENVDGATLYETSYEIPVSFAHTQEDIDLLTAYIISEAPDRGLNAWVALTEMIINRVEHEDYPNSIKDVLLQGDAQLHTNFTTSHLTENVRMAVTECLAGRIRIIQNKDVLHYKHVEDITNEDTELTFSLQVNGLMFY